MSDRKAGVIAAPSGTSTPPGNPHVALLPLRLLTVGAGLTTGLIAIWLLFVLAMVMPARDPERIPMWSAIAAAMSIYAALTLGFAAGTSAKAWIRVVIGGMSMLAVVAGAYGIAAMLTAKGRAFEGYVLVMGIVLVVHGSSALAYVTLRGPR
jgi:hypothetical protein